MGNIEAAVLIGRLSEGLNKKQYIIAISKAVINKVKT